MREYAVSILKFTLLVEKIVEMSFPAKVENKGATIRRYLS
jgi:hypothetical protein